MHLLYEEKLIIVLCNMVFKHMFYPMTCIKLRLQELYVWSWITFPYLKGIYTITNYNSMGNISNGKVKNRSF